MAKNVKTLRQGPYGVKALKMIMICVNFKNVHALNQSTLLLKLLSEMHAWDFFGLYEIPG